MTVMIYQEGDTKHLQVKIKKPGQRDCIAVN